MIISLEEIRQQVGEQLYYAWYHSASSSLERIAREKGSMGEDTRKMKLWMMVVDSYMIYTGSRNTKTPDR